ncbi:Uncharacterised protein [Veillonella criceti]|uniref:Uncharacterized protein n=2 Tax=Veillonella criceti TaxID=103891 RepID=A0A380NNI3_9FIRM|nr:Uncharacterised protein [Veillonella criceti]
MNQVMYRVGTIGEENSSTGSLRLLRGMAIFERLPIELQILGVGLGSLKSYLVTNFIVTIYDNNLPIGNEYMNTLSYILVNTGIVGITFFIIFVGTLFYKYQEYGKRVLIICWLFFSIASSDFLSINYVYPLMLITSRSNN